MKKYIIVVALAVLLLFTASIGADAIWGKVYVNDSRRQLIGFFTDNYAIGDRGVAALLTNRPYVLSARGVAMAESDGTGVYVGPSAEGAGFRVTIDSVRVGLRYYYSEKRDTSMQVDYLENAVGNGYEFGYFDSSRQFVSFGPDAWTSETKLTIRPLGSRGIGIYSTTTNQLLYGATGTGKTAYLAVRPLCETGEAVTWFAGRRYYGDFGYADLGNGKLTVMNVVGLEHYVAGVCAGEMGSGFPLEALKAQAVAARSYAMYQILYSGGYISSCGFDLSNDDYSQVYLGYTEAGVILDAVAKTENEYLTYGGKVCNALYFAADGGETLDSEKVFPNELPYLRGKEDPYEEKVWTKGVFGHQVGMSQWGARAMAEYFDMDYTEILGFYYTDVELTYGN